MTPTTAVADKIRATGKPINAIANNAGVPLVKLNRRGRNAQ